MPLPLLHAAAGYAVYHGIPKEKQDWKLAATCMLLANAADLDFIPGILVGKPDLFHHSFSHSFTAAAAVGLFLACLSKFFLKPAGFRKTFLISFLAYATHVVLDLFLDHPSSMPLFWPLTPGQLSKRLATFQEHSIHLGGFDNFICDRFLSLGCLKRFAVEILLGGIAGLCFFIFTVARKKSFGLNLPFAGQRN